MQRGRLFRRYFLLILALVCGALLISGGIGLYFSYQENKVALASLQHEKALSAAARIEQFVLQIEQQLAYAALPQLGVEGLEQRRIEFLKLLRVVHAVTDITQIDSKGKEQLSVSRLKMDEAGTDRDWSGEPAFKNARPGQTWYGPVYFRKETEPYMSIAVRSGGEAGAVTVAEVNLKFIWDVITRIKVGQKGKAYVVDGTAHLVADPDIGLVLRKTDMAALEQVKSALQPDSEDSLAMLAKDLSGTYVLTAFAPIEPARDQPLQGAKPTPLGWKVFVEQPVSEVYQALDATVIRTVALLVAGLLFSALVAMWLARSMARPIGVLQEGAQRIGAGDLDSQISIKTGDELESLADQFNRMTAQLRESYAGLERKVEERTTELKQALEQQTAISEILRVISNSPSDVQPVLDAVVERAARICEAQFADIVLSDGAVLNFAAATGDIGRPDAADRSVPLDRTTVMGRSIVDRQPIHIADLQAASEEDFPRGRSMALQYGHRTILALPLMRENKALGTIVLRRREVRPFEEKYIALLKTFADQAAIAIENVRLFNETAESLEQQTAISDALQVISSSPTDVQPVFDTLASSARQLTEARCAAIVLIRDSEVQLAAVAEAEGGSMVKPGAFPMLFDKDPSAPSPMSSLAFGEGKADFFETIWTRGFAATGAPIFRLMIRAGDATPLGAIIVFRADGQFSEKQKTLLTTFANQAVIAIENVRLFNETTESLDQQTATSEILKVISSSQSDVRPVLDAVADRATRLCDATASAIYVLEGGVMRRTAFNGPAALEGAETLPYTPGTITGRAIADGKAVHVKDMEQARDLYPVSWERAQRSGQHHTMLAVPLLREGKPFGAMFLRRVEVRSFTDKQIALATTFADQAAIAIENVRLFNETKEALEQQKASSEVLGAISSSIADTKPVFDKILQSCERLFAGKLIGINVRGEDGLLRIGAYQGPGREDLERIFPLPVDPSSGSGLSIVERRVIHYPDVNGPNVPEPTRIGCGATGIKSVIFSPMLWEDQGLGAIFVGRDHMAPFSDKEIALLKTFSDQAAIAIQNTRLFREIQEKSAQLEIANKHKSEFLANMSHELRTPLNAIIGFSEVLIDRMFGEVNDKQADYLKDIHESGKHLLSLINDILDLSKIEAGRMDLDLSTFHLPTALSNAMTLIRERAQRHSIQLGLSVDPKLAEVQADERKVKQILVNLLSNAVKFTPDGGRVDVIAKMDTTKVAIAVQDTGIGIAPEDHAAVFEEFKQVGRDYTRKAEGTGLGLALTKRFVELHGGEISLTSTPGKGSTFTITLPIRH